MKRVSFRHSAQLHVGAAVLGLALALGVSAYAQSAPPSQPAPQDNGAGPRAEHGDWAGEKFERQEFREEMEKIRKEHEELEAARDKLLDQCVNAKDAQAAECEKQKQALHEWHDRLHERMRALHEKMEAAHRDHPEGPMQAEGGQPWPHPMNGDVQPSVTVPLNSTPTGAGK